MFVLYEHVRVHSVFPHIADVNTIANVYVHTGTRTIYAIITKRPNLIARTGKPSN